MDQYSERRSEARLYYRAHLIIEESGVCFIHRARLVNFNDRGLYFQTDFLLQSGAKVCIGIYDPDKSLFSKNYVRLIVEIKWRNRLTDISFNYGYGALEIHNDGPKDLRKHPRKTFSKSAYFASKNKYHEGVIKNLSCGGAFVETKTIFSNGDELKLVVPGPNKYIQIRCKIIHFNQTGFGVKFKRVLKIEKLPETKLSSR
jgi:hypothetical protein